ncbi:helix-turn-helix transcriptional regulator [Denitratimonas sp. CY0512]|uniref:helix-turn-helix domain-containing protein n=1 Tax=Denitratimonas sp. CY0512 TaxID=3131940 RepID=UPI0016B7384E|nr:helix-turn-helix transcriptional regulator [Gammaproteobacteria bacterium]
MIRFKLRERIADKEFREGRRITLVEVAEATGTGRITLSRMLKRGAVMRTDTLDRLCAYFECDLDDLAEYLPDESSPDP